VFAGKKVIVRTLDIGGDKSVPYLALESESNPMLGLRGIRLCLCPTHLPLFRTQLRALLRAAKPDRTSLWIMLPMVSEIGELRQTRALLAEVEAELLQEGRIPVPIMSRLRLGIMVETPAAALLIDIFAREVDFFSIGTNDLTQYTLARDRTNATLADPHRTFHPALMRSVAHIVTTARTYRRWVGVCGEIASNPRLAPFLVGLGVNELSMEPNALNAVKQAISRTTSLRAEEGVQRVLQADSAEEVESILSSLARSMMPQRY
jgi:phosphoenolpyruvate-protein phosphotransferase (PTS system enzyme I)